MVETELKTLLDYVKKLQSSYFRVLEAFYVFEALEELRASNISGKQEAEENVKIMNRAPNFWGTVRESLRIYILIELAKLFDDAKRSLHINKIVNFASSNISRLSKDDFLQFHQDRAFLEELFQQYRAMDQKDLTSIRTALRKHQQTLQKLDTYRNQYLAHNDRKRKQVRLSVEEIKGLMKTAEEILNLFLLRLDFSTTVYNHIEEECKNETKGIIAYLKRFEPYRRQELKEKYGY